MSLLRKKGPDTIDYTFLKKKGLIKTKEEKKLPFKIDSKGMVDLTSHIANESTSAMSQSQANSNPFGFLDTFAASASTPSQVQQASPFESSNATEETSTIRVKIDDLEYKMERLVEKLTLIESKLQDFEKKVFN